MDEHLVREKLKLYEIEFSEEKFRKSIDKIGETWKQDLKYLINPAQLPDFKKVKEEI